MRAPTVLVEGGVAVNGKGSPGRRWIGRQGQCSGAVAAVIGVPLVPAFNWPVRWCVTVAAAVVVVLVKAVGSACNGSAQHGVVG